MKASFYQEMTTLEEQKEMSKVSKLLSEEENKVDKENFLGRNLTSEELKKLSKTLKAEIAYARSNFNRGEAKDTRDIWKQGLYDSQRLFYNEYLSSLEKDIYYISDGVTDKKEEYIYDEVTDICYKVKDTSLSGYIVHSLEYAKLMLEGKYETKQGMEVKVARSIDGTLFYEPDLNNFSYKTEIVYYSSDLTQKEYKPVKEYIKEGKPSKIKIGEDTYTFADYSEGNKIWANIRCKANGLESWWVWIPRYTYKLNTTTNRSEIIFVGTDNKPLDKEKYGETLPEGYTLHEAFTQGDGLKGIWFSKYEPTESGSVTSDTYAGVAPDMSNFSSSDTKLIYYNKEDMSDYKEIDYTANPSQTVEIDGTTYYFYSYEDKIWANIKCTANEIVSYWVWIPRYAYNIDKEYSTVTVVLIDTDDTPLDKERYGNILSSYYTVHEAFTQGDGLKGIWFSKYEPTEIDIPEEETP